MSRLKGLGIEVIFHQENIRTSEADNDMLISVLGAIAQSESESTGEAIKWGLKRGFISGNSKLYSRKCFGYKQNEDGELIIDEKQAEVVRAIFDLYLSGLSIGLIVHELEKREIKSPQGKDIWSKKSIQTVLGKKSTADRYCWEKPTGDFPNNRQFMNDGEHEQFLMKDAHEPIIDFDKFEQVRKEMERRSNIEIVNGKTKRKRTHYSTKRLMNERHE